MECSGIQVQAGDKGTNTAYISQVEATINN